MALMAVIMGLELKKFRSGARDMCPKTKLLKGGFWGSYIGSTMEDIAWNTRSLDSGSCRLGFRDLTLGFIG